jgi:Peroxidase
MKLPHLFTHVASASCLRMLHHLDANILSVHALHESYIRSEIVRIGGVLRKLKATNSSQKKSIGHFPSIMFLHRSILLSLLLAAAHACPYLDRKQDKPRELECHDNVPHQKIRRAQVVTTAPDPTTLQEAITTATNMITTIVSADPAVGAKCIRLSFHDCVGGICDGCVDLMSPSNFGLKAPIDALASVVTKTAPFLTTGDVWALCGLVSARVSQANTTTAKFPLQFVGRPHCAGDNTTGGPDRKLPSAHFTTQKVLNFFANEFGFTANDTVSILGCHSRYVFPMFCAVATR